jgi:hypothetical protein
MKLLVFVLTIFLGAGAPAQTVNQGAGDTVGALNQITPERDDEGINIESKEEQQDAQERIYQENLRREEQEWQSDKQLEDYRFDVPGP